MSDPNKYRFDNIFTGNYWSDINILVGVIDEFFCAIQEHKHQFGDEPCKVRKNYGRY